MRRSGPAYLLVFVVTLLGAPPAFSSPSPAGAPRLQPSQPANRTGWRKGCLSTQNLDPLAESY